MHTRTVHSPAIRTIAALAIALAGAGVFTMLRPPSRCAAAAAAAVPLIPRKILFGNPDKASPQVSPDGTRWSYLAPVNGVLNVWVGPSEDPSAAKPVTKDTKRGIRIHFWAFTNRHVLYLQDQGGDENWHVHVVDLESGEERDLTPIEKVNAQIQAVSFKHPNEILIGLNDRDPQYHDIYRVNLLTAERTLLIQNPGFAGFVTDNEYRVRFAERMTDDGGEELLKQAENGEWEPFLTIGADDSLTTGPAGFDKSGRVLRLIDSRNRNTAALTELNLDSGEQTIIAENPKADISGLMVHPTEKTIQAVSFTHLRKERIALDPAVGEDFAVLRGVANGDIEVLDNTLDDQVWMVAFIMDDGPVRYFRYDRKTKQAQFLFTNRVDLEGQPLVAMRPEVIRSRDGLDLVSYLSLPAGADSDGDGRPDAPVPMVLNVHGGPWGRDAWGLDPEHQWLTNRGYAALSVNFRGSTGFGKAFTNAGNMEWGRKMHDDLIDAVHWAVENGIADPKRIGIYGGSYGGYATLVGLTFTPDTFACGISLVGPSNLITLLNSFPPYWKPAITLFTSRVGDHRTEEGQALLRERSPLTFVDRIQRPLLIGQGANDPRVTQAEADQIVTAMRQKGIPVTYALYSDEGHGFARPENRLSFYAVAEAFLAEHLGGRYETAGDDFAGSTIAVPTGAEGVPGLEEALAQRKE